MVKQVGMVDLRLDLDAQMRDLSARLGQFRSEAPRAMANAMNKTARRIRRKITQDAKGRYVLRDKTRLNATQVKLSNARPSQLTASMFAKGEMQELLDFMVSERPVGVNQTRYFASVLKSSALKAFDKDPRPFLATFQSGHTAIVVRKGKKRFPLEKLLSPAVPHMLNNPRIAQEAREMMADLLPQTISQEIERILIRHGRKA